MSGWLWAGTDPEVAARKREAKEAAAVASLRGLFDSAEGRQAALDLVQGGELASPEEATTDAYLRRWLFAREWDVPLTYSCMVKHAGWRAHVMPHGYIDEAWIAGPLASERVYLQGADRLGRGLAIIHVASHFKNKTDPKQMKLFTCYTMNALVAMCDARLNPRGRLVSMFDMGGCSMANMDVAALRMILGLLGQHYVERLDCMYFYDPPSVFWGLWNSLKGLLPPVTRSKIKVIDPSDTRELRDAVPDEVLPREYGGAAELLPIRAAVRRFRLPPFPHVHDLPIEAGGLGAAHDGSSSGPSVDDGDELLDSDGEPWADASDAGFALEPELEARLRAAQGGGGKLGPAPAAVVVRAVPR